MREEWTCEEEEEEQENCLDEDEESLKMRER